MATTHRSAVLRADVEAHEASVPDDNPALFLIDLHTAVLDAAAGCTELVDVATWLTASDVQARARRWLAGSTVGERVAFEMLVTALRIAVKEGDR